ncbi:MAG: 40S ribosomal protein S19 [Candidatus Pacearchaeota archaeon]|jgi:small subunit ribosomal protein S19e
MTNKIENNPVYEMSANEYNTKLAEALKQIPEFKEPEWSFFVKSGVSRIKPPTENGFWFKRAASILRQAYVRNIVGVNRLRTKYGSKQNRGMRPERFKKASGKIIRNILQQAEAAGLLEKYNVPGKRAGRKLTIEGKQLLEGIK